MIDQLRTMAPDEEDAAVTFTLTPDGWEAVEYVEPTSDWTPLEDGSYESPDGTVRSYPQSNPAGA